MKTCFHCFGQYGDEFFVCPHCGTIYQPEPKEQIYLDPGTMLANRYLIGESIGAGGFGVVYRAWDYKLETIVAIKEYFPTGIVTRAKGNPELIVLGKRRDEYEYRKKRFLLEARSMAKFGKHRNIPNVFEFFEANQSAYIVMELLEGIQLNDYVKDQPDGRVSVDFAVYLANEVGMALQSMHEASIIHRDVAPDNIFLCEGKDRRIKLMDLGAAKIENSSDDVIDLCMKVGYSPVEQYDEIDNFGPWSDIYALGATMYFVLTGMKPYESTSRKKEDLLQDVNVLNPEVSENLNNTIMKAMAVNANDRFKNIPDFLKAVNGERRVLSLAKEKRKKRLKVIVGIGAALMAVAAILAFSLSKYGEKRRERYLRSAAIEVWFCRDAEHPLEEQALNSIVENFQSQEGYGQVEVQLRSFEDRDEYEEALEKAAEEGTLPALFESTGISNDVLIKAADAGKVISEAKECSFFSQYESYYEDHKRIPLAVEVPVAYVLTRGAEDDEYVISYEDEYFDGSTFNKNVFYNRQDRELLDENDLLDNAEVFDASKNNWSVVYAASVSYSEIRQALADKWFAVKMIFFRDESIKSAFTYEWSIGSGSKDEINAAEHFAAWLLGANAQVNLLGGTGMLPVNDSALDQRTRDDDAWIPIMEIKDQLVFEED